MTAKRLVTYADIAPKQFRPDDEVSISAHQMLELEDGSQVLLLNDRGWGGTGSWDEVSAQSVYENARMVVGPDAPPPGRSQEEEEARNHWVHLQKLAERQGIAIGAEELRRLPHDVVIRPRLLARLSRGSETEFD
jgi:hypothetical protein